jgi:predicted DNA-binding transcriptional regulator YafY
MSGLCHVYVVRRRERLFAIAEYLRARRLGVTAEAMAERFQVTVRTIYRDLDSLRDAGLPVRADRGRGGGYALDRAYTLPPVNFTPREAALLVTLGNWAAEMRLLPFASTLEGALDKVRGALSASAQRELLELMAGIHFVGVPAHAVAQEVRRAVEQGWFERQPIRIRYRGADGTITSRAVRIESAVMERSVTLLNCDDLDKGERRQFRLDRIIEAKLV